MAIFLIFGVDENVIWVYNNIDIKLFCQNLINTALECGWYIGQAKRLYLILEMAIVGLKGYFLFIAFLDPHPMIDISKIKLGKIISPI